MRVIVVLVACLAAVVAVSAVNPLRSNAEMSPTSLLEAAAEGPLHFAKFKQWATEQKLLPSISKMKGVEWLDARSTSGNAGDRILEDGVHECALLQQGATCPCIPPDLQVEQAGNTEIADIRYNKNSAWVDVSKDTVYWSFKKADKDSHVFWTIDAQTPDPTGMYQRHRTITNTRFTGTPAATGNKVARGSAAIQACMPLVDNVYNGFDETGFSSRSGDAYARARALKPDPRPYQEQFAGFKAAFANRIDGIRTLVLNALGAWNGGGFKTCAPTKAQAKQGCILTWSEFLTKLLEWAGRDTEPADRGGAFDAGKIVYPTMILSTMCQLGLATGCNGDPSQIQLQAPFNHDNFRVIVIGQGWDAGAGAPLFGWLKEESELDYYFKQMVYEADTRNEDPIYRDSGKAVAVEHGRAASTVATAGYFNTNKARVGKAGIKTAVKSAKSYYMNSVCAAECKKSHGLRPWGPDDPKPAHCAKPTVPCMLNSMMMVDAGSGGNRLKIYDIRDRENVKLMMGFGNEGEWAPEDKSTFASLKTSSVMQAWTEKLFDELKVALMAYRSGGTADRDMNQLMAFSKNDVERAKDVEQYLANVYVFLMATAGARVSENNDGESPKYFTFCQLWHGFTQGDFMRAYQHCRAETVKGSYEAILGFYASLSFLAHKTATSSKGPEWLQLNGGSFDNILNWEIGGASHQWAFWMKDPTQEQLGLTRYERVIDDSNHRLGTMKDPSQRRGAPPSPKSETTENRQRTTRNRQSTTSPVRGKSTTTATTSNRGGKSSNRGGGRKTVRG